MMFNYLKLNTMEEESQGKNKTKFQMFEVFQDF